MNKLYTIEIFFKDGWHGVFSSFDMSVISSKENEYKQNGFEIRVTESEFKFDKKWSND